MQRIQRQRERRSEGARRRRDLRKLERMPEATKELLAMPGVSDGFDALVDLDGQILRKEGKTLRLQHTAKRRSLGSSPSKFM